MDPSSEADGARHDDKGPRTTRFLLVLIGVLVVGVVLVLVTRGRGTPTDEERVVGACDLGAGPCRAELGPGASVEVTLAPRPIPLAQPLGARVALHGLAPARGELRIRSTTMKMGLTRIQLEPHEGALAGESQLPVCVSGPMTWLATLRLDGEDVAHFRFDTRTP